MSTDEFQLALPALAASVDVTSFTGRELVNAIYRFDVTIVTEATDELTERILESPVTLTLRFGGFATRRVHGIVGACEATGLLDRGRTSFVVRIVPRLATLENRRTCRIFQDQTSREIVEYVLQLSGIRCLWQLKNDLQRRPYCVQYDETNLAFVKRLLASEGLCFYFDHPPENELPEQTDDVVESAEVMIVTDAPQGYRPIDGAPELLFRPGSGSTALGVHEDHVQVFRFRRSMTSKRVLVRRYDFKAPTIPRYGSATLGDGAATNSLHEMEGFVDSSATVYEHDNAREEALVDPIRARTALEAETVDGAVGEGETVCRRLLPGHTFQLVDHPAEEANWSLRRLEQHARSVGGRLRHRRRSVQEPIRGRTRNGRAATHAASARAPAEHRDRHCRRPARRGDQHRRVRSGQGPVPLGPPRRLERQVLDLAPRVMQPWAGAGYGAQFLPRIGHEVVVGSLEGDPDRPIVRGSLRQRGQSGAVRSTRTIPRGVASRPRPRRAAPVATNCSSTTGAERRAPSSELGATAPSRSGLRAGRSPSETNSKW